MGGGVVRDRVGSHANELIEAVRSDFVTEQVSLIGHLRRPNECSEIADIVWRNSVGKSCKLVHVLPKLAESVDY